MKALSWFYLSTIQFPKGGLYSGYLLLKLFASSGQNIFSQISNHPKSEVRHWGTFESPINFLLCIFSHHITFKNVVPSAGENFMWLCSTKCAKVTCILLYWRDKKCRSWNISAVNLISVTKWQHNRCSFYSLFHFLKFL